VGASSLAKRIHDVGAVILAALCVVRLALTFEAAP
jgi:hypothetical protein